MVNCPPGLQFNTKKKVCDWPTGSCKEPEEATVCENFHGEARRLCQERMVESDDDNHCFKSGTFADPSSCNKYYSCNEIEGKFKVRNLKRFIIIE